MHYNVLKCLYSEVIPNSLNVKIHNDCYLKRRNSQTLAEISNWSVKEKKTVHKLNYTGAEVEHHYGKYISI